MGKKEREINKYVSEGGLEEEKWSKVIRVMAGKSRGYV